MVADTYTDEVKWGDIILVDFGKQYGSTQHGIRPALVIQNNKGNQVSPTIIVCGITSANKKYLPTHVNINPNETGLRVSSIILAEQMQTISKDCIIKKCGSINSELLIEKIQKALTISLGLLYNDFNTAKVNC